MDVTSALGAATGTVGADRTGSSATAALSREDFMSILLAEMSHQDPMNPVGNQEFLSQLAQLQTLEATSQLTAGIEQLVALGRLSAAGSLIGMNVRAEGADGTPYEGVVEKIVLRGNQIVLSVGGAEVPLSGIVEMWNEQA